MAKKTEEKKKRVQAGKVVRLGPTAEKKLSTLKREGESWNALLERIISGKSYWLVPSLKKVFETKKEAKGMAVLNAVQSGKDSPEDPVKVREE